MLIRQNLNELPNKNYVVHFDKENEEYYGVEADTFELPKNIYGNNEDKIDMYLTSFFTLEKNLGILLQGIKGGGISLMAKQIMLKAKLPVLIINEPFCGNKFTNFINNIDQEAVLFFDEFEKEYEDQKHQEELLTLFDGVEKSKKMFLLTTNKNSLNEYFVNRPSRIRFKETFNTVSDDTLEEIIEDLLVNKDYKREVEDIVYSLGEVGKDLIISIIEEVNIREVEPKTVIRSMNIEIPRATYDYIAKLGTQQFEGTSYGNPLDNEKLNFDKWYDGFEYTMEISALKSTKTRDKISLQDHAGNIFYFCP